MITLACKSFRVRHQADGIVLELDAAEPANLVPQLLTKSDVAQRLAISERKVETLAAVGRLPVVRIDSCVRFREADILQYLTEHQAATLREIVSDLPARVPNPT